VVRDPAVWREVVLAVAAALQAVGLAPLGVAPSPIRGPEGNAEFLLWSERGPGLAAADVAREVNAAVEAAGSVSRTGG
jgi:23S rRNA (cytidine1920-2'-O)/16S rRNA (cytidine1409-2'-O)-methyltransferase